MEFRAEGGIFTHEMMNHGLWEIHVPWQVAIDALAAEGVLSTDRGELREWINGNAGMFANMVAARIDERQPAERPDDPRITMMHIQERRAGDHESDRQQSKEGVMLQWIVDRDKVSALDSGLAYDAHSGGLSLKVMMTKAALAVFQSGDAPPVGAWGDVGDDFYRRLERLIAARYAAGDIDPNGTMTFFVKRVGG